MSPAVARTVTGLTLAALAAGGWWCQRSGEEAKAEQTAARAALEKLAEQN